VNETVARFRQLHKSGGERRIWLCSLALTRVGKLPLRLIQLRQSFLDGIGRTGGETANVIGDRCEGNADDLQIFVKNLTLRRD
jgi:hypothetical protein